MHLLVHNIQRFCLHDGPGIRTTVFLQGCHLGCWWCQNPAAQPPESPDAMQRTIADLAETLQRDRRFFEASGGGVTASGGEPLAQSDALAELLVDLGRRGIHRAVDTSGAVRAEAVDRVAPHVDLWLWDLKHVDPAAYRQATGGDVDLPLGNLERLLRRSDAAVRVRVPLIAGFNDDAASLRAVAARVAALPRPVPVELLPGHDIRPGRDAPPERSARTGPEQMARARDILRTVGAELLEPAP